jgi:CRP-like cAMP-binding protein
MTFRSANRLLFALQPEDFALLEPHLSMVDLPLGTLLFESGDIIPHVYFPVECVVSIVAVLEDGTTPEMVTLGREGMVGLVPFLGDREAFGRYTVQLAGRALRMSVEKLDEVIRVAPQVREHFLRFLQALVVQTLQTVACNAVHPVEARCCRWILMIHDRVGADLLPLTHEFLAAMLGVHRPTVTIVTRTLQNAQLIEQHRRAISVLDRKGLEEAACECYSHIRRGFERLLPHTYKD